MADDRVALHATLRGRVQGVGFRDFVQHRAAILRLSGYVRNGADGRTVEVLAEGPRADLERLLAHLQEGPRGARIDALDVTWGDATWHFDGFRVTF